MLKKIIYLFLLFIMINSYITEAFSQHVDKDLVLENVLFIKEPTHRLIFEFSKKPFFDISKEKNKLIFKFPNTILKNTNWINSLPKEIFKEFNAGFDGNVFTLELITQRDFNIQSNVYENRLIVDIIWHVNKKINNVSIIKDKLLLESDSLLTAPTKETDIPIIKLPLTDNYTGSLISVDFQDADLRTIMRLFAEIGNMNIIFTEPINGTVTMKVSNVPWDLLFDSILSNFGLTKINHKNLTIIKTIDREKKQLDNYKEYLKSMKDFNESKPMIVKIYKLKYTKAKELANKISLIIGKLDEVKATQRETITIKQEEKGAKQEVTKIELTIGRYGEKGSITFDDSNQLVIIKTTPNILKEIEETILALDRPAPQILIEARIVEISDQYSHNLGVKWGGGAYRITEKTLLGIGNIPKVESSFTRPPTGGGYPSHNVNLPTGPLIDLGIDPTKPMSRIGLSVGYLGKSLMMIDLELHALEEKGLARIFAKPRIITLNNHPAEFKQGYKIPYLEITGQNVATTKFIDAVMGLRVTPHITPDNRIYMDIEVERTLPDWSRAVQNVPPLYTTLASTRVLVNNEETFVIGGIKLNEIRDNDDGIPGLSEIPGAGYLFKRSTKSSQRSEFMVFLTPKIVTVEVEGVDY